MRKHYIERWKLYYQLTQDLQWLFGTIMWVFGLALGIALPITTLIISDTRNLGAIQSSEWWGFMVFAALVLVIGLTTSRIAKSRVIAEMKNLEISHLQGGEKIMEQTYYLVLAEVGRFQTFWLGVWKDESIVYVDDIKHAKPFSSYEEAKKQTEDPLQSDVSAYKIIEFTYQELLDFRIIAL
ncbi:hypothetical protein [Streptococcus hyointestinalis]|uniref:hypothetical protein n=1 Tax=Streptococcus hyointestinalis TaxID=1337 RepID=UPI003CFF984C